VVGRAIKSKPVLVGFLVCGICDFVLGFVKFRSILGGIGAVFVGLPLSAVIVFSMIRGTQKDRDQADDSHGQH
jgi:hypothetical protein